MEKYSELTLTNWKKWDLIRLIKQQEENIEIMDNKIQEMYLSEKISYASKIELLETLTKKVKRSNERKKKTNN